MPNPKIHITITPPADSDVLDGWVDSEPGSPGLQPSSARSNGSSHSYTSSNGASSYDPDRTPSVRKRSFSGLSGLSGLTLPNPFAPSHIPGSMTFSQASSYHMSGHVVHNLHTKKARTNSTNSVSSQLRRRSSSDPMSFLATEEIAPPEFPRFHGNPQELPVATSPAPTIEWKSLTSLTFHTQSPTSLIFDATLNGSSVIVKLLKSDATFYDERAETQFDTEISLLAENCHCNVVQMVARGAGNKFVVVEKLSETLHVRLEKHRGFHIEALIPSFMKKKKKGDEWGFGQRLKSALELARAVRSCHFELRDNACVLHRDINPNNVGFRPDGTCVLLDFSHAKAMHGYREGENPREMTGGARNEIYQAPEVSLHNPYGAGSDVWSWAVVAWEMLTMSVPYGDVKEEEFLSRVVEGGERLKCEGQKEWPEGLGWMLGRCFEEVAGNRPSIADVVDELEKMHASIG